MPNQSAHFYSQLYSQADDANQSDRGDINNILEQVAQLESELHVDGAWNLATIQQTLDNRYNDLIYFIKNNEIVAYCIYQGLFETAEIYRIGTNPTYHKQGYASRLLAELDKHLLALKCEQLLLEVRADNAPAINLYHKHNFLQIDKRKNYYQTQADAIDALIMQKQLL